MSEKNWGNLQIYCALINHIYELIMMQLDDALLDVSNNGFVFNFVRAVNEVKLNNDVKRHERKPKVARVGLSRRVASIAFWFDVCWSFHGRFVIRIIAVVLSHFRRFNLCHRKKKGKQKVVQYSLISCYC